MAFGLNEQEDDTMRMQEFCLGVALALLNIRAALGRMGNA